MENKASTGPILFVGAFTLDTLYTVGDFSTGPGKYLATESLSSAAGMATTAATAAARLGGTAALWASIGDDANGDRMIAEIRSENVDCRHVRRVQGARSATAAIIVDQSGERWVIVDYDPATKADPEPQSVPPLENVAAVMADVRWPAAARIALKAARAAGKPAVLDADLAAPDVLDELARCATHIVASASGAALLSEENNIRNAVCRIAETYGCFACVTDGERGSVWALPDMDGPRHVPSPKIAAVDTNGAGDVFHGAFVLALAEGQHEEDAIRFASAAAALNCTVLGARLGAPNRPDTLMLMQRTYR